MWRSEKLNRSILFGVPGEHCNLSGDKEEEIYSKILSIVYVSAATIP